MLKRLGVVFMPNGKLRPREPKELNFPVLKNKKRVNDVARTRLKRKILEAIKLVVTRGANVDPEHKRITFTESEAGEAKWVLRGQELPTSFSPIRISLKDLTQIGTTLYTPSPLPIMRHGQTLYELLGKRYPK
ncbi:hypothetical protein FRC07_004094 [Ceratobasidium sp. 392]|nr:hypothetical protein FRC07_004094 [Ceratobasidium sp. 392]